MSGWNRIVGHEWAVALLKSAIQNNRLGHAYLFTGPEQVGKVTVAHTFAQALNCELAVSERPCGQCRSCKLIADHHHPDVRLIEPQISGRGKRSLKIDEIRALQSELHRSTVEGRYRIVILSHFDSATAGATNAFLKSLEEPPSQVIIMLTAPDADNLLPTIVSRCRTLTLRPLDVTVISEALQSRWHSTAEQAKLLSHLAGGRIGWAVEATQKPVLLDKREQQLDTLAQALAGNRVKRFALADKLARKPEFLPELLRTWLDWWRDLSRLLLANPSSAAKLTLTNIDRQSELEQLALRTERTKGLAAFKQTDRALWQLEHNANARLVMENLLLTFPLPTHG